MRHHTTRQSAVDFATAYADQSGDDETTFEIPDAEGLAQVSDERLSELHAEALENFNAIHSPGGERNDNLTEDDLSALSDLTDGIEVLNAEIDKRQQAATERAEQAEALAARVNPTAGGDGADEGDEDGQDADSTDDDSPETVTEDGEAPAGGDTSDTPAEPSAGQPEAEQSSTQDQPEAVAASSARRGPTRINMGARGRRQPVPRRQSEPSVRDVLTASADIGTFGQGQGLDFTEAAALVERRMQSFNRGTYEGASKAGKHITQQFSALTIRKPFDPDLTVTTSDHDEVAKVIQRATDEKRLPQGSLTAAGGWCAPSETVYDMCELESRDGILSLPEIGTTRGGINFTKGPDWASIFSEGVGFSYTEEEDIAGDYDGEGGGEKPCVRVPCPEFEEERLGLRGLCVTSGILQQRGYPEMTARFLRGLLVAHEHHMAAGEIEAIVADSTAVTMPTPQPGTTAALLTSIELQVEHFRYVHRMARSTTLEAIFPFWVRGAIRSDLSKRLGVELLSVTDAQINAWFTSRGVAPQFIYNWQDLSGAATGFTSWPETVSFALYAAGTWVKGASEVLTIDTLYDSMLLGQNDYTALFTEEGFLMMKTCHDSRVVTVPVCSDGATAAGIAYECDGTTSTVEA